mgnify:FL=1
MCQGVVLRTWLGGDETGLDFGNVDLQHQTVHVVCAGSMDGGLSMVRHLRRLVHLRRLFGSVPNTLARRRCYLCHQRCCCDSISLVHGYRRLADGEMHTRPDGGVAGYVTSYGQGARTVLRGHRLQRNVHFSQTRRQAGLRRR